MFFVYDLNPKAQYVALSYVPYFITMLVAYKSVP